jgi:hypothetical protein
MSLFGLLIFEKWLLELYLTVRPSVAHGVVCLLALLKDTGQLRPSLPNSAWSANAVTSFLLKNDWVR